MNPIVALLTGLSALAALLSFVVYFLVLAKRPSWMRIVNGSGLFFTGMALMQLAALLPKAASDGQLFTIATTVALLNAGVLAQSYAIIRNRKAWDGVDRRQRWDGSTERRKDDAEVSAS